MTHLSCRTTQSILVAAALATAPSGASAQGIPDDFTIALERTTCFGSCPAYSVSVDALGNVTYEGKQFVRVEGRHTDGIPRSRVAALAASVERIRFFNLRDQYKTIRNPDGSETSVTDLPTFFVTVTRDGQSKRIEDYIGAPPGLRELEEQIDVAAETKRWVRIDAATVRQMLREGRPPSGEQQGELLHNALEHDDVDVVKALLESGADPNGVYYDTNTRPLMMVRSAAATRILLDAGAIPSIANDLGSTPLGEAADLAADVTAMLLKAGAPADQPDADGRTPLWRAACAGNVGVVKLLLDAGADPGIRVDGRSAVECARDNAKMRLVPAGVLNKPLFVEDVDGVIALLHQAAARRRR